MFDKLKNLLLDNNDILRAEAKVKRAEEREDKEARKEDSEKDGKLFKALAGFAGQGAKQIVRYKLKDDIELQKSVAREKAVRVARRLGR